jgi:hypothetical protein
MRQIYHFSHTRLITKRPKTQCPIIVHIQCLLLMVGILLGKRAFGFNLLILLFKFKIAIQIAIHLFDKRSIRGVTSTLILYAKFHNSYSLLRKKKWTKSELNRPEKIYWYFSKEVNPMSHFRTQILFYHYFTHIYDDHHNYALQDILSSIRTALMSFAKSE